MISPNPMLGAFDDEIAQGGPYRIVKVLEVYLNYLFQKRFQAVR